MRWLYKTFAYVPAAIDKNVLGVAGFGNQYPSQEDLTRFKTVLRSDPVDVTFTVEEVNDDEYDPSNPGEEANLDMQYTCHIVPDPAHLLQHDRSGAPLDEPASDDPWCAWLIIPNTISILYTLHYEMAIPLEYAVASCELFTELGARGVSIVSATGDEGVAPEDCKVNDTGRVRFILELPATCTCGILSLLASGTQMQAHVAYRIVMVSQVPMSLASVARRANFSKSRRVSPRADSRTIL